MGENVKKEKVKEIQVDGKERGVKEGEDQKERGKLGQN